ncbi:MAG TPA: NUDIX hydrolase [Patescibacteria group bacterium]|nr:NUDIX hydrolase [Patescibacteria group bacterium]
MDDLDEQAIREKAKQDGITHLSTGVAIVRDGKILMVRRAKDDFLGGNFELPGGGVDEGESIQESALREITEETGLVASKVLATFEGFDYSTDKKPRVRQTNFIVAVEPGEVALSAEHDDFMWVDGVILDGVQTTGPMRTCVRNALAKLQST